MRYKFQRLIVRKFLLAESLFLSALVLSGMFFLLHEKEKNGNEIILSKSNQGCKSIWKDAPSISLMCRAYSGSIIEYYNIFLVGYHLFWPKEQWPNSELVVVLDDENELDHRLATILTNLPPYPRVFFEKPPNIDVFCKGDRRAGYSRQQYSNFYSDLYTNMDYVGIVDSDSFFMTPVIPENLFVDRKPRIYGYNGCCTGWEASLNEAIGVEYNVGEFMVVIGFPVMVKRKHFKPMRAHITKRMKAATFEEAFHKICSKYLKKYSQFDLIAHYLWFHHRDEYSWHIADSSQTRHPAFSKLMTDREEVLAMNRPIQGVMKHGNHHTFSNNMFKLIGDYLCLASDNEAGSCKQFFTDELREGTYKNLFVERQFKTADWDKRGMVRNTPEFSEIPWSLPNFTHNDVHNVYKRQLNDRNVFNTSCIYLKV